MKETVCASPTVRHRLSLHLPRSIQLRRSKKLLTASLFLLLPFFAFAWSAPGHKAIVEAALQMLQGSPAGAKVQQILGNESFADAAVWLDLVREHAKFGNPAAQREADQFNRDFPSNGNWHFTNYIVGSDAYDPGSKFSSADDVVHALENAISVLEGGPSKMTKLQALRVVVHLVGDIHQPLHCITGYYDLTDMAHPQLLTAVSDPAHTPEDRGGNQLYYSKSEELHALWDRGLPSEIATDVDALANAIKGDGLSSATLSPGDYHHWPEVWASDSMRQGAEAYKGIFFSNASDEPDPRHPGHTLLKINIDLPGGTAAYKVDQKNRVATQLHQAAVHLTQLLSSINFQ
jgi:hypothetical protein